MRYVSSLAAMLTMAAVFAASTAWGQMYASEPPLSSTTTTTSTTTVAPGSAEAVAPNPNSPEQFPPAGNGNNPTSHEGNVKAVFVDQQIAAAQAQGRNTSAAENQEIMGQADLKKGLNKEAAQHFDAALRSLGITPSAPERNSGEAGSVHHPMP